MTKVSMLQYKGHLCKKNWGKRKSWTQREKSRRGEDSSLLLLFTCCYKTAKSDMLFQERLWLMAFCRETITMTASPDAQLFQVALSKTNVWNALERAQDVCATFLPLNHWSVLQYIDLKTGRSCHISVFCIRLQCPLYYSLVKMVLVMVGPDSKVSREQILQRKIVNICFVTWPPFTGNVSLNEA